MKYRDQQHADEHRRVGMLYLQGIVEDAERKRMLRDIDRAAYKRQMARQWSPEWVQNVGAA